MSPLQSDLRYRSGTAPNPFSRVKIHHSELLRKKSPKFAVFKCDDICHYSLRFTLPSRLGVALVSAPSVIGRQGPATGVCDHAHGGDDPYSGRHSGRHDHSPSQHHLVDPGTDLHGRRYDRRRHAPGIRPRRRPGRLDPNPVPRRQDHARRCRRRRCRRPPR